MSRSPKYSSNPLSWETPKSLHTKRERENSCSKLKDIVEVKAFYNTGDNLCLKFQVPIWGRVGYCTIFKVTVM